jgi:hypothetical protein
MWYLLKVDALMAFLVFGPAALLILLLFLWQEAKGLAATLAPQVRVFANSFAISRTISRTDHPDPAISHRFQ